MSKLIPPNENNRESNINTTSNHQNEPEGIRISPRSSSVGHYNEKQQKDFAKLEKRRQSRAALVENDRVWLIAIPTFTTTFCFIRSFTGFPIGSTIDTSEFATSYFMSPVVLLIERGFFFWVTIIVLFGFLVPGASAKFFFFYLPNLVWLAALIYFALASLMSLLYIWENADFQPRYEQTDKRRFIPIPQPNTGVSSLASSAVTLANDTAAVPTRLPIYQPRNLYLRGVYWAWILMLPTFALISVIGFWTGYLQFSADQRWPSLQYQWFKAANLYAVVLFIVVTDMVLSRIPYSFRTWWLVVFALLLYYCWIAIADKVVIKPTPYNNFGQSIYLTSAEAKIIFPVLPFIAIAMHALFCALALLRDRMALKWGVVKGKKLQKYQ